MLYKQVCNKHGDKSNRWSLWLSLSVASSTVGAISCSPSLAKLFIVVHQVPWRIFSNSTFVHKKWVTWVKPRSFWGDLSSLWQNLIVSLCTKFESSSFSHSRYIGGLPKFTRSSAIAEGPHDALVSTNHATKKHPILKWLQSTNDLDIYTPKVIVIAAFT